jgi:hypothetical protein
MNLWKQLWNDETGAVLTAEVVMVGTVAVLGSIVGLNAATTAVDEELKEFAGAIRSLDQSYGYLGHQSCRAWSAGSYYRQQDVQVSLQELCGEQTVDIGEIQQQVDAQRALNHKNAEPPANQLPEKKVDEKPKKKIKKGKED